MVKNQIPTQISYWDIIGMIADIQTSFNEYFKLLEDKYEVPDARLQVFFNCADVASVSRLGVAMLIFSKEKGFNESKHYQEWQGYYPQSFHRIDDFDLYVDDKMRHFTHRMQEQMQLLSQIYIESFIRNLGRQFNIDENVFWKLRKKLFSEKLKFTDQELIPLTVYQYLKNSLHNKGVHYDQNFLDMEFNLNGYVISFKHSDPIQFSWHHLRALLVSNSNLLYKIVTRDEVSNLPKFDDRSVVVLRGDEKGSL